MDLNQRCFFVLSGVSNILGKSFAVELCRKFKPGSVAMLFGTSNEILCKIKKEISVMKNGVDVICCNIEDWKVNNAKVFRQHLDDAFSDYAEQTFDLALIVHNEGEGATRTLVEPQDGNLWKNYVQENLHNAVALNQEFLKLDQLRDVEKLVVNVTSSFMTNPFIFRKLNCSCKMARDMYFRSMASEEHTDSKLHVLNYSPGILPSHEPVLDSNNNILDLCDIDEKLSKMPRVEPHESTLKLINILEEMSFISGHEVDYYDTYNL